MLFFKKHFLPMLFQLKSPSGLFNGKKHNYNSISKYTLDHLHLGLICFKIL